MRNDNPHNNGERPTTSYVNPRAIVVYNFFRIVPERIVMNNSNSVLNFTWSPPKKYR